MQRCVSFVYFDCNIDVKVEAVHTITSNKFTTLLPFKTVKMLHNFRTSGLRLLATSSNFTMPKCRSMMSGQRKSLSNTDENLNRISSTIVSGLLAIGAFTYYRTRVKMEERLKDCEYLPEDENYKITNVK